MNNYIWQFLIFRGIGFAAYVWLNVTCKQLRPERYRNNTFKKVKDNIWSNK